MFKIVCKEMTGSNCDFAVEGDTAEAVKNLFYQHGAESEVHKEHYHKATPEEKAAFGKQLDEYLAKQK